MPGECRNVEGNCTCGEPGQIQRKWGMNEGNVSFNEAFNTVLVIWHRTYSKVLLRQ